MNLSTDPRRHAQIILRNAGFELADQTIADNILTADGDLRRYWIQVHAALWGIIESARTKPAPPEE